VRWVCLLWGRVVRRMRVHWRLLLDECRHSGGLLRVMVVGAQATSVGLAGIMAGDRRKGVIGGVLALGGNLNPGLAAAVLDREAAAAKVGSAGALDDPMLEDEDAVRQEGKEGESGTTGAVVLTVLFGPIGLIKHGKNIDIKQGTSLKAFVSDDTPLPPA